MSKRKRAERFVGKKIEYSPGRVGLIEAVLIDRVYCRPARGESVHKDAPCFRLRVSADATLVQKVNSRVRYDIVV